MVLSFTHYSRPFEQTALPRHVQQQLEAIAKAEGYTVAAAKEEWGSIELVDVVDDNSQETLYQLYLYPFGSGQLFHHKTTTSAGYIAQHGLEVDDPDLFDALQAAFEDADYLEETVDFD